MLVFQFKIRGNQGLVEKNTDRLWFTVGAIIVGAVIIFMYRDNVGNTVKKIFDKFNIDIENVVAKDKEINFEGEVKDGYIVAQVRAAYTKDDKYYAPIWGKYKIEDNDELTLVRAAATKEHLMNTWDVSNSDYKVDADFKNITGDLIFPNNINGKAVTKTGSYLFSSTKLDGDFGGGSLKAVSSGLFTSEFKGEFDPGKIETIGDSSFSAANFTGDFNGKNIKSIGANAFLNSIFDGEFNSGSIETIGVSAFFNAKFTGDFNGNHIKSIGSVVFYESLFDGDFHMDDIEYIGDMAFANSTFEHGSFYGGNGKIDYSRTSKAMDSNELPSTVSIPFNKAKFIDFHGENMTYVPDRYFLYAKFSGKFDAGNLIGISYMALDDVGFSDQELDLKHIKYIGAYSMRRNNFTGDLDFKNVEAVYSLAFDDNKFTGDLHLRSVDFRQPDYSSATGYKSTGILFMNIPFKGDLYLDDSLGVSGGYGAKFRNVYANNGRAFGSDGVGLSASISGTAYFEKTEEIKQRIPYMSSPFSFDFGDVKRIETSFNGPYAGVLDLKNIEYIKPGAFASANFTEVKNPNGIKVEPETIRLSDETFYTHD